jgi:SAM-dependent methyltransferase
MIRSDEQPVPNPASCRFQPAQRTRIRWAVALCAAVGWYGGSFEVQGAAPVAADFAELAKATEPLQAFLAGNVIIAESAAGQPAFDSAPACNPFPADSRILAYEEHRDFIYAVGDASPILPAAPAGDSTPPRFLRRYLWLKPNLFVVDDVFRRSPGESSLRWVLGCRSRPIAVDQRWQFTDGAQQLVWETLWPTGSMAQRTAEFSEQNTVAHGYGFDLPVAGSRLVQVFSLSPAGVADAAVTCTVKEHEGELLLAISASQRTFHLKLPPADQEAGSIALLDAAGQTRLPRRPLAAGVLPHGPEGMRLLERWDSAYRDGRTAPWDTKMVAPALQQAVESGAIKPCRTVTLGCGTGANAIYLARRGFDVTAIDVAPTALGLAADKARQAGVRVRWLLADVLALPDLQPFDLVFDRGCYHNVRYVDAVGFVESLRRLTRPGSQCLILSCNRDSPPGVREETMRDDFSALFDFVWLRDSGVEGRDGKVWRESWSLLMQRKSVSNP